MRITGSWIWYQSIVSDLAYIFAIYLSLYIRPWLFIIKKPVSAYVWLSDSIVEHSDGEPFARRYDTDSLYLQSAFDL